MAAVAPPAPPPAPSTFTGAKRFCDIVMKGGITSGIVYPRAITELAQRYRFVNVGGSSAGAIAAACAAAAERGRDTSGGASFVDLWQLPHELGELEDEQTRLLRFFQPDPTTRRTFRFALKAVTRGLKRQLALRLGRWPVLAALAIAAGIGLAAAGVLPWWPWFGVGVVLAVLLALVAAILDLVLLVRGALKAIAGNTFGLGRLGPVEETDPDGSVDDRPLTIWLHRKLRRLAFGTGGDGPPLTFGDLWRAPRPGESDEEHEARAERVGWDMESRTINLELMTTDLTRGRAIRLPVPLDRHESAGAHPPVEPLDLIFERGELSRFFPATVVAQLCQAAGPLSDEDTVALRQANGEAGEFFELPTGDGLPVVVAVRMSLSFPFLISAMPLWRVDRKDPAHPVGQRVILSDGGITSNFPIHFFDGLLPKRPTFAVNLVSYPFEPSGEEPPEAFVVPPTTSAQETWASGRAIDGIGGFVVAIKDAMQNWHDNGQQRLPGFRDRVVGIGLARNEGGLKLDMDDATIRALGLRGGAAGTFLGRLFAEPGSEPGAGGYWNRHRFVRYRIAMALLDRSLRRYRSAYGYAPGDGATRPYAEIVADGASDPDYPYEAGTVQQALATSTAFDQLVAGWAGQDLDDAHAPRPSPDFRIAPRS